MTFYVVRWRRSKAMMNCYDYGNMNVSAAYTLILTIVLIPTEG